jgi:hypothetical protein
MKRIASHVVAAAVAAAATLVVSSSAAVAAIVGLDFNTATAGSTPPNWNPLNTAGSIGNLIDDNGVATGWSFGVTTSGGGFAFASTPSAATIPTHSYSLAGIDHYLTGSAGSTGASQFSNLPPLTVFNVWAFGLRGFTPLAIDWTVAGANTVTFSQNGSAGQLWVNGELGTSARTLSSYAIQVTSSATGTIDFTYDPVGTAPYAVAGLALEIVPEPALGMILCCAPALLRRRTK